MSTGAVHLDLYLTGYRSIPEVGWLFLVQAIAACGLGMVVHVSGSRLAAAGGVVLALSTPGSYLLSLRIGLFRFRKVSEVTMLAALAVFVLGVTEQLRFAGLKANTSKPSGRLPAAVPSAHWGASALTLPGAVLLGLCLASPGPATTSTRSTPELLKTAKVGGVVCYRTCALYWPPVAGIPRVGLGVTGELGTIRRSHGAAQVTYDGHPLTVTLAVALPVRRLATTLTCMAGCGTRWAHPAEPSRLQDLTPPTDGKESLGKNGGLSGRRGGW